MTEPSTQLIRGGMFNLRQYQTDLKTKVDGAWNDGAHNVLMVLPTGGGKSKLLGSIHADEPEPSCVIAHRQGLISQLSMTLCEAGLRHDLIAADVVKRTIIQAQLKKFGVSYFQPQGNLRVASIDTLIRASGLETWASRVKLWTTDEGHHVVEGNKWHRGIQLFTRPDVRGLLPTATPLRADGKGLGRHASGIADAMVEGPPMRWLIEQGYLTDYDIILAKSDLEMLQSDIGADGDFTPAKLKAAAQRSHIVGDVVSAYLEHARGKLGIIFTTDVATACSVTTAFRQAGIKAETLTGDTDPIYRVQVMQRFEDRNGVELIVAVDIISEGTDVPAVEMGTFGRPTASLQVYMQQFGRFLRPMYAPGYDLNTQAGRLAAIANGPKPRALVIDQVGNWSRHGPPDKARVWSMDDKETRRRGDGIPTRMCGAGWSEDAFALARLTNLDPLWLGGKCYAEFERFHSACPFCHCPVPPPVADMLTGRRGPEQVEGDLVMMDRETLAQLRGEVFTGNMPMAEYQVWLAGRNMPAKAEAGAINRYAAKLAARTELWAAIEAFGGPRHAAGRDDRSIQREFYLLHGVDVLSAQTLTETETKALTAKVLTNV